MDNPRGHTSETRAGQTSNNSITQKNQKVNRNAKKSDGKDYALPRDFDWDSLEEIFAEADDTNSEMFDADAMKVTGKVIDAYGEINAIDRRIKLLQKAQRYGIIYLDETVLGRSLQNQISNVSHDAILSYKSSESYKINEAIRSGREFTSEEVEFIRTLDKDLESNPRYSGVTYRNLSFDLQGKEALDKFVDQHIEGQVITYPAYTSTSKSKEGYVVDGELVVHIEIKGKNGYDISNIGIEEEQEVLFGRQTDFYVSSVSYDGKNANIVLEEITHGEREISESDKRDSSTQQGYNSKSRTSEVQRMPTSGKMDVQKTSQRNSQRDSSQREDLQRLQSEGKVNSQTSRRTLAEEIEFLENQKKAAGKQLGRSVGAMASSALFMAIIRIECHKKSPLFRGFFLLKHTLNNPITTPWGISPGVNMQSFCGVYKVIELRARGLALIGVNQNKLYLHTVGNNALYVNCGKLSAVHMLSR